MHIGGFGGPDPPQTEIYRQQIRSDPPEWVQNERFLPF